MAWALEWAALLASHDIDTLNLSYEQLSGRARLKKKKRAAKAVEGTSEEPGVGEHGSAARPARGHVFRTCRE